MRYFHKNVHFWIVKKGSFLGCDVKHWLSGKMVLWICPISWISLKEVCTQLCLTFSHEHWLHRQIYVLKSQVKYDSKFNIPTGINNSYLRLVINIVVDENLHLWDSNSMNSLKKDHLTFRALQLSEVLGVCKRWLPSLNAFYWYNLDWKILSLCISILKLLFGLEGWVFCLYAQYALNDERMRANPQRQFRRNVSSITLHIHS